MEKKKQQLPSAQEWQSLKELIKCLQECDEWTFNTKYLELRLDTRLDQGDYWCLIKDKQGDYLTIDQLKQERTRCK